MLALALLALQVSRPPEVTKDPYKSAGQMLGKAASDPSSSPAGEVVLTVPHLELSPAQARAILERMDEQAQRIKALEEMRDDLRGWPHDLGIEIIGLSVDMLSTGAFRDSPRAHHHPKEARIIALVFGGGFATLGVRNWIQ